jgi:hypothetical protein
MSDCKIAYYINNNIQHFPPVHRLQSKFPGLIIVRGEDVLQNIQKNYPELAERTYFIKSRSKVKSLLRKHKVRMVIYPAFKTLNFGLSVEVFHGGLSDKRYLENAFISMYDLVLFPGQKSVDKVEKAGLLEHINKYKVIGYPKFDPLINQTLAFEPVFNNGKPTVLYAPTWISNQRPGRSKHKFSLHGESSLPLWGVELLKQMPESANLIVKFHCLVHEDGNSVNKQMEQYVKDNQLEHRIKILYQDNILPFMAQSQVMISDISSACYEWFHFDRPIIFANPSPEHYKKSDDITSNTYAWQSGDVINHRDDIRVFIDKNLANDQYQNKRNELFNYSIFQPDGYAIDRQSEAIEKLYNQHKHRPYTWFLFIAHIKHLWRALKMNLHIKGKVDKLAGLE